jgi:arylsulfatase
MDIAPTFLEIAKTIHPGEQYQGKAIHPIKGKSMIAMLNGKTNTVHPENNVMGWELFNRKAIRKGAWKSVWIEKPHGNDRWSLFNLKDDPLEQYDLAGKNTQKLNEMISLWKTYKKENGIIIDEDLNLSYSGSNSHFDY